MPYIDIILREVIIYSRCLWGYNVQLLVTSPYVNDSSMAISHPRIKKPFFMNLVCLKPATPNPKMRSKGKEYIIERGVKLKFVQGILNIEKMPIAVIHIINVIENFARQELTVSSSLSKKILNLLFNQMIPKDEKNSI